MSTTPRPPAMLDLNVFGIPTDLTSRDQWVLWRLQFVDGRWTKVPIEAKTGNRASTTDPNTWTAFSAVLHFLEKRKDEVHGIGFVFAEDDEFCGIDLDQARDPATGELTPEAQAIVDRFDSFTEWSISGTGVHIYVRGALKAKGNRKPKLNLEVYDHDRFFVVSGQVILNPGLIGDRSEELDAWHREIFPEHYEPKPAAVPISTEPLSYDDAELLKRCEGSEKFQRLNAGDDSDYGDDTSSADLAFCNIIVRNGGTRAQVDALYRQSNRARSKWDSRRGQSTYGEVTLDEAFDGTVIPFSPGPRLTAGEQSGPKPHLAVFIPDDLPDDIASLKLIIFDLRSRVIAAEQRADAEKARADKLSELQSKTTGIIRNKNLGQERFTAVALAYHLGNRESTGDTGDNGLYRMPLARIAESAGVSEDTASKHLQKLAQSKVIRRELKWIPESFNQETGEKTGGYKALYVGPASNVTDFVDAVARLEPDKPKNWGGTRVHCPDHPDADVIKETTWTCAECGELLKSSSVRGKPQDADLVDDLAATGTDGPQPRHPTPRVVSQPLGSRNDTTSHNVSLHNNTEAMKERLTAAWKQPKPLPAYDRYTDISIGGRE